MADMEKVIKVYECCKNPWNRRCEECPIEKDCCHDGLPTFAIKDALAMLKEQGELIERLEYDLAVAQNNLNYYINGND